MSLENLIEANNCKSKEEVRQQIDIIDYEIMKLFAKRYEYVKAIVNHKEKNADAIVAQKRKDFVIQQRGDWATKLGLDEKAYRILFSDLIDHNISKELEILQKEQ